MTKPQPHTPSYVSKKVSTPFEFGRFCEDVRYGRLKKVKAYLEQYPDTNLELISSDEYTPLMLAARHGQHGVFKYLLDAGANVNAQTKIGQNMLHLAAIGKNHNLVEAMISGGFDVNAQDDFGRTPLLEAATSQNIQLVKMLLDEGADPNICDEAQLSPLMRASVIMHFSTVDILLQNGAILDHADRQGKTALDMVRQKRNRNSNTRRNRQSTLHMFEKAHKWQETFVGLVRKVNTHTENGFNEVSATWIELSARRDFARILKDKIQKGQRPSYADLTRRNADGMNVVDILRYTKDGLNVLWDADLWRGQEGDLDRLFEDELPGWQRRKYVTEVKRVRAQLILEKGKLGRNRPKLG